MKDATYSNKISKAYRLIPFLAFQKQIRPPWLIIIASTIVEDSGTMVRSLHINQACNIRTIKRSTHHKGGIYLFDDHSGIRYPDFYKDDMVLDAKYKRLGSYDKVSKLDRNDVHQVIAYIYDDT